ncbi:MAG: hypothetical protein MUC36_11305 [Planctomycetes bacterium]|nr:hypothetical protein [Planctomycetota bacterium]
MNSPRDDQDPVDPMLERLLAGELDLDDPTVRDRMQQDPDFAAEAEALLTLAAELDPPPKSVRGEPEPWAGADRAMVELVQKHGRPVVPIAAGRRRWPWLLAAAAAALVVAALMLWPRDGLVEPTGKVMMGDHNPAAELVVTRSRLAEFGFDWSSLTALRTPPYRLQFLDLTNRPLSGLPAVDLRTKSYLPPADLVARLPREFVVEITEPKGVQRSKPWTQRFKLSD